MQRYDHVVIEKKWQERWEKEGLYRAKDLDLPRLDSRVKAGRAKKKFYHLVMFPYPSGDLHIGHWYNFAGADFAARYYKRKGLYVMSPIGFDAFGLPAENAALKKGIHPKEWTEKNTQKMREQLRTIGASFDWSREINTSNPEYYKWTQWIFLQFYQAGLAYRKKAPANWCPKDQTVLANEQVIDGKCERCDTPVVQKEIEQWLFAITKYADRLLADLENLDWPERTKAMQRNWIGKSEGAKIKFQILNSKFQFEVFTTRPDTLFGATYVVLAPEHPLLKNQELGIRNKEEVEVYIEKTKRKTELERIMEEKAPTLAKGEVGGPTAKRVGQKTGVELKGVRAINPANGEEIPVWIADYVLASYGTGAIMAVPAHDERDFAFANSHKLPIKQVIVPQETSKSQMTKSKFQTNSKFQIPNSRFPDRAYEDEGLLIHSGEFDGLTSQGARDKIVEWLSKKGKAKKEVQYKLRDWLISRQRYWGAPIPIVYCEHCGMVPVPEKDLPVLLPDDVDFSRYARSREAGKPSEDASPLARHPKFPHTKCPTCGKDARRETDTMDTFVDSSWYYLRYTDPDNREQFATRHLLDYWCPVDLYVGGAEHSVLHLLYARFFAKVLFDQKLIGFDEPFTRLRHQGTILGPDGQKMSKSKGNVVDPDALVTQYGADTVRVYLAFMGPYELGGPWNPRGIAGARRFLDRVWRLASESIANSEWRIANSGQLERIRHRTVKKVTEDIESFHFNTAIASLMEFLNKCQESRVNDQKFVETLVSLLSPFVPHFAEELWEKLGHRKSIFTEPWPSYDEKLIAEEQWTIVVQVNGKVRGTLTVPEGANDEELKAHALNLENVKKHLSSKRIKKTIVVPGKLVSIVTT